MIKGFAKALIIWALVACMLGCATARTSQSHRSTADGYAKQAAVWEDAAQRAEDLGHPDIAELNRDQARDFRAKEMKEREQAQKESRPEMKSSFIELIAEIVVSLLKGDES